MTSNALKSLSLSAFRGSTSNFTIDFEKDRKFTLIYGENGTGKTTICDAFEFLAKEKVGSLEDRGMGSALSKFWHTAGKNGTDLLVTLKSADGECSGSLVGKKYTIAPHAAKPRIELLRRQQILALIEAAPAKRYEEIKRFIDIGPFEASEEALRQLGKRIGSERDNAQLIEDQNLVSLQDYFHAAEKPVGSNPVSWAKSKLATPATDLASDISAIGKLRVAFQALMDFPERAKVNKEVLDTVKLAVTKADETRAAAATQASEGASNLLELLEAGQAYMHAHPSSSECPLCRSNENVIGLEQAIKERIGQFSALQAANTEWKKQKDALSKAEAIRIQIGVDYSRSAKAYEVAKTEHQWPNDVQLPNSSPPENFADLPAWLLASNQTVESWAVKENSWRGEKQFITALSSALEGYENNHKRRIELSKLVPQIDEALKICLAERQAFTDSIIKEIAEEVGRLYEAVHPGEGLDKIALPLDPDKRASLELKAKFSGQEVPPQAYYSQSHLDTLGLCVFLALALRDRSEETILILDDVLGSVDEPHVERVIQMIYGVSGKFRHTIVTTHYGPWRNKYRWGWLKPDQPCQFIELHDWTIGNGIRSINSIPEIDRLKTLLNTKPVDPQAICSKAGVILEAALDYLTQKYECSLPRRAKPNYTIGDFLQAIDKKLREALKIEIRGKLADGTQSTTASVELKVFLDELQRIAQVRNVFGAHFNEISFEMLDSDTVGFANQVVLLIDALTCPVHGWPSNDKSGSYWRNSGDTRRLHPLKKPG
jgi:energy-coupling factor transporter ATP-binding protein EcfA2